MVNWEKSWGLKEKILIDILFASHNRLLFKYYNQKFHRAIKKLAQIIPVTDFTKIKFYSIQFLDFDITKKWRITDSRENLVEPTFSKALFFLKSLKFPNYHVGAPNPLLYSWILEDYPELFASIQNQVNEGNWEILGGEWNQFENELISCESIIRSRLNGQRFYAKELNIIPTIGYFQLTTTLDPIYCQILKKSGISSLYIIEKDLENIKSDLNVISTKNCDPIQKSKFLWKDHGKYPILTHYSIPNLQLSKMSSFIKDDMTKIACFLKDLFKNNNIFSLNSEKTELFKLNSKLLMEKLILEEESLENSISFEKGVKILNSDLAKLSSYEERIQSINIPQIKPYINFIQENNRTIELLLYQSESLSIISQILGDEAFQEEFSQDWKILNQLQFPNIVNAKSICEVYRDAALDFQSIISHLISLQENSLMKIAHRLREESKQDYYTIFNPLNWERSGYSTILRKTYLSAFDSSRKYLMVQRVSFSSYYPNRETHLGIQELSGTNYLHSDKKIRDDLAEVNLIPELIIPNFEPEKDLLIEYESRPKELLLIYHPSNLPIKSIGIKNIQLIKAPYSIPTEENHIIQDNNEIRMTNKWVSLKISKIDGKITYLGLPMDKKNLISNEGLDYIFLHKGIEDPILIPTKKDQNDQNDQNDEDFSNNIIIEENGPLRYTILIKHQIPYMKSRIHTRISIYHDSPLIYGETLADWQEDDKEIRMEFIPNFKIDRFCAANQFRENEYLFNDKSSPLKESNGIITSFQDYSYIINEPILDSNIKCIAFYTQKPMKIRVKDDLVQFCLIKSIRLEKPNKSLATLDDDSEFRSKYSEIGFHRIPWAIEIIKETLNKIDIVHHALEYNNPFVYIPSNAVHQPISFLKCHAPNVIITSLKQIEEFMRDAPDWFYNPSMAEAGIIIRCVEYLGKKSSCKLTLSSHFSIKTVMEVDLLERIRNNGIDHSDVSFSENIIQFSIQPYEVKTILVVTRIPLEEDNGS